MQGLDSVSIQGKAESQRTYVELPVERLDEDEVLLLGELDNFAGLVCVSSERLFQQNMLSGIQSLLSPLCAKSHDRLKDHVRAEAVRTSVHPIR